MTISNMGPDSFNPTKEQLQETFDRLYKPVPYNVYVPPTYYVNQKEYDAFTKRWPWMAEHLKVVLPMKVTETIRLSNGNYYVTAEMDEKYGDLFTQINDFSYPACADTVEA